MTLLTEIHTQTRLKPLKSYISGVQELGVDVNDEDVKDNIHTIIEQICGYTEDMPLEEMFGKGEYKAGRDMAQGAGVDLSKQDRRRNQLADRLGGNNPRLGMQSNTPNKNDYVKFAGGGGIGTVMGVKGSEIIVKTKGGYTQSIEAQSLKPKHTKHPKTGHPITVWIEAM